MHEVPEPSKPLAYPQRNSIHLYEFRAKSPDPSEECAFFYLRSADLQQFAVQGRGALLEAQKTIGQALSNPSHIYTGIRRDRDESRDGDGWLCYAARVQTRYEHATGRSYYPGPAKTFLVFITKPGIIYTRRWEPCNPIDGQPDELADRFRRKVYP